MMAEGGVGVPLTGPVSVSHPLTYSPSLPPLSLVWKTSGTGRGRAWIGVKEREGTEPNERASSAFPSAQGNQMWSVY